MGEWLEKHTAGAEAHPFFCYICGPTEVVPLLQSGPDLSFSAACKAQHLLAELTARLKSCPDASCNLHGILQVAPKKAALELKDPLFVAKKAVFAAPKGWLLGADFHDAGKPVRIRAHRVFLVKVRFAQQSRGDSGVSCNFFLSGGELICKVLKINIGGWGS